MLYQGRTLRCDTAAVRSARWRSRIRKVELRRECPVILTDSLLKSYR